MVKIKERGKKEEYTWKDMLIKFDAIFKLVVILATSLGLIYLYYGINTFLESIIWLMVFVFMFGIIIYYVIYKKYINWLKTTSELTEYKEIFEHLLVSGIIIHTLWILILVLSITNYYTPQSKIMYFSISAILWIIPVHLAGIAIAPKWHESRIKKFTHILGLAGLAITFILIAIPPETLPILFQSIGSEWFNQFFALMFISTHG